MALEADDYRRHVDTLLVVHSVSVHWKGKTKARANREQRWVRLSPVKTANTYATALHAIGCVVGRQQGRRLDREVQAWNWAKANAVEWTTAMQRVAERSLRCYVAWYVRRFGAVPMGHAVRKWVEV